MAYNKSERRVLYREGSEKDELTVNWSHIPMGERILILGVEAVELLRGASHKQNKSLGDIATRLIVAVFADLKKAKEAGMLEALSEIRRVIDE